MQIRLVASSVRIVGRVPFHIYPLSTGPVCTSVGKQLQVRLYHCSTSLILRRRTANLIELPASMRRSTNLPLNLEIQRSAGSPASSQSSNFNLNSCLAFYITEGNTVFLLHCSTDRFISSDFNCSLSRECRAYMQRSKHRAWTGHIGVAATGLEQLLWGNSPWAWQAPRAVFKCGCK